MMVAVIRNNNLLYIRYYGTILHQEQGVMAEWSNAQDLKSCSLGSAGSNPAHVVLFADMMSAISTPVQLFFALE